MSENELIELRPPKENLLSTLKTALEKDKLQIKLKEDQCKLNNIINTIPDFFILVSDKGVILNYRNNKYDEYLSEKISIGKKLIEILPQNIAIINVQTIRLVLESDLPRIIEYQLTVNGITHYFEARYLSFFNNQVAIFLRDITDCKEAEYLVRDEIGNLRLIEKMRNDLYLKIAQELKAILIPVDGATDLLISECKGKVEESSLELLKMIDNGCKRMKDLIDKYLEMSSCEFELLE